MKITFPFDGICHFISACALLTCTSLAFAGSPGEWGAMKDIQPRGYVCGKSSTPIMVDGKLDDADWQKASWTEEFIDIEGLRRPSPRQRTRAKLLWDRDYLYIAAELAEKHIQATVKHHDEVIFQDNDFEVFIDPDGDNQEYYEFEMNAINTTWDLFLPKPYKDGGQADNRWEFAGMKTAVHINGTINDPSDVDTGWTLEIAIPWTALKPHAHVACPPMDGDKWRMDFSRVEWQFDIVEGKYKKVPNTKEDNWVWSPQGIVDMHRPERWGFVQFSSHAPSDENFVHDGTLTIRDCLMEIYHRQRAFMADQHRFASSLKELEFEPKEFKEDAITIHRTMDGYQVNLRTVTEGKPGPIWHVRNDSKLWATTGDAQIDEAFARAGANRSELESALARVTGEQLDAMEFLVANMPDRDLKALKADFLVENVRVAFETKNAAPWNASIPSDIFLNNVLPYANINEGREAWRADFRDRFRPLIEGATTPSQAAAMLNQKLFPLVKVKYSTQRAKADQNPTESIKSGLASCTGLSILLIDACRSLGIPARFVGTPLWSDDSGNHSWVEIWDDGWHFTGAAEPNGDELDKAWFVGRASTAKRDDVMNAIYAVSFQKTPLKFPLVWDRSIDYVRAVNVTDRYTNLAVRPVDGTSLVMFRVLDASTNQRIEANISIYDVSGKEWFSGKSKDERFDANDHLQTYLPNGLEFKVEVSNGPRKSSHAFKNESVVRPITVTLAETIAANAPLANSSDEPEFSERLVDDSATIASLTQFLASDPAQRPLLAEQNFASVPINPREAAAAEKLLWQAHVAYIRQTRAKEMEARELVIGEWKMPFTYQLFGEKPATGRSMYISMHGGGGAPAQVNTQQWENQKRLYKLDEGVYVVPRAPTDTWNLWHQAHIDQFFDRIIENLVVLEDVDPNRVYIMGYSAGGDGVYQLAPRMADRLAAAAMMAGHPNETSPLGLRNLPFTLHMGAKDSAYNRNKIAAEWSTKLDELQQNDPEGYVHFVKIHDGKGHWMDRQDAEALPWMAQFTRNPFPTKIVWKQDDVVSNRFYWLAIEPQDIRERAEVIVNRVGQNVNIQTKDVDQLTLRFNDSMVDLEAPIKITSDDKVLFEGKLDRSIGVMDKTLRERGDSKSIFSAEITVRIPR